jgi:hypothetical protein
VWQLQLALSAFGVSVGFSAKKPIAAATAIFNAVIIW